MRLLVSINGASVFSDTIQDGDEFSLSITKDGGDTSISNFTEAAMVKFDAARSIYPGKKRGNTTEFLNFRKKHKDWKEAIELLYGAIVAQAEERKRAKFSGRFVPEWPNFQTWINQRRWEEEITPPKTTDALLPNQLKFKQV